MGSNLQVLCRHQALSLPEILFHKPQTFPTEEKLRSLYKLKPKEITFLLKAVCDWMHPSQVQI